MTIRKKLLLFIPLLVLLTNAVTFFLFESAKIVQQSYDVMMNRILLYQQSVQTSEANLKSLYSHLLNPSEESKAQVQHAQKSLQNLRADLDTQTSLSRHSSVISSLSHMLDTLLEQERNALDAADAMQMNEALSHYEEAEKTTGYIRDKGQQLVDLELNDYQPVFQQVQQENERMNRLGAAVFVVNTLMSVVLAVWISRSVTLPVSRIASWARQISRGNLHVDPPPLRTEDELGVLSGTFKQMLGDLKELMKKDKEHLEKDKLVKELELQALQSQMNPHFLFNTLNVLSKLALLEGAEKTSELIISMSNLLRYNLRRLDQPVTLRDELNHIKEYMTIQKARFRDRVRFELDADESALGEPLPSLTIQPLVENAFVHGIEGMEQGALIRLVIRDEGEGVRISVSDNGRGMTDEVRQALLHLEPVTQNGNENKKSTGLGTRNVFKRLQLLYERSDLVEIDSEPGKGTTVTLWIPRRKDGENAHVQAADRR